MEYLIKSLNKITIFYSLEQIDDSVIRTSDGTNYSCTELNSDDELARISEWGFPIFHFAERHPETTLSRVFITPFEMLNNF